MELVRQVHLEKREEYLHYSGLSIDLQTEGVSAVMSCLDRIAVQRALSNAINNAVEALNVLQTTSTNYLLLASIDLARRCRHRRIEL